MESGTSGDRRILVAGGRGRHAAKETDNGRSGRRRKKERKERARGTSQTRRHPWQRYVSKRRSRARARSSMRDVDGLVKPRLRGRTTETERNDDDFLAKRPRAPVPRIQISRADNRQVLSSLHYRSNSVSVAFNREKFTVSG